MLTLLLGKDWIANREAILRMVAEDVHNRRDKRILMVPELISHDMERRLCVAAGDTASRYAEVLSFSRLVRSVAETVGIPVQRCMDAGGRVTAMAAATRQLHSKLKAYASVETRPEFLTGLVDAVDEFKRCCITAADLKEAANKLEGSFAQKLEELSLILEAYDAVCARGKLDPRDQMTWLLEQIIDSDYGQTHTFYIDGFPDFTRQNMAIIEHFIKSSPRVVVSLNCDRPGSSAMAFEKAGQTALDLLAIARRYDISYDIVTVDPVQTPLQWARDHIFQGQIKSVPMLDGHLLIYNCENTDAEMRNAVNRILSLVHNGCRYRDIGVVCTDMHTYRNTLMQHFNRCNIPAYISGTDEILDMTVINTVVSAMEAALGGFERQDMMRYLKSALSPLKADACDALEDYAILWGISGNKWLTEWINHPSGLDGTWNPYYTEKLRKLNEDRKRVIAPLQQLRQVFRDAKCLKDQVRGLCGFFDEIHLADRLRQLADTMEGAGDHREAQVLHQLWEILLNALEQLYDVLGDSVWDAESFCRLFTLLLSQYDVGTIPPVLDAVTVGPVSAMRCQQVQHLIVLGAHEGMLPGYCGSTGVLSDQERDALRKLGVTLTGGSLEGLQAEFAEIYGVFCGATQSIAVSCGGDQPSFVYRRLADLSGACQAVMTENPSVFTNTIDAAAYVARNGSLEQARQLGIENPYLEVQKKRSFTIGSVQPDVVQALYGDTLHLSATQVDRQAKCRFSYFMQYGLRAKERKEATVDPAQFGTYVHAVLEETGKRVMDLGGFHQVSLEKTMEIARECSDAYAAEKFSQLDSKRMAYLFRRNTQELELVVQELWQELSTTEFVPAAFEVGFDKGEEMPPVDISGGKMAALLRGFVDRVDVWNSGAANYFRVVDYKTGRKDFDYCDVFNGIGLQMLLYLFALAYGGDTVFGEKSYPAGVLYFPARAEILSVPARLNDEAANEKRSDKWARKGLVLDDQAIIAAMEPEGSPHRLPEDVLDREQLAMLRQYVFKLLGKMVDEIASGKVAPNPYTRGSGENACDYCPYKAVCHNDTVEGRRNYQAMSAKRFWEEIGKELSRNGS